VEKYIEDWVRQSAPDYKSSKEYMARQRALDAIFGRVQVVIEPLEGGEIIAPGEPPPPKPSRTTAPWN
jgi:hypothetical protein